MNGLVWHQRKTLKTRKWHQFVGVKKTVGVNRKKSEGAKRGKTAKNTVNPLKSRDLRLFGCGDGIWTSWPSGYEKLPVSVTQCYFVLRNRQNPLIFKGFRTRAISMPYHTVSSNITAVGVSVGVKTVFGAQTQPQKHSLGFDTTKDIILWGQNKIENSSSGFLLSNK